MIYHESSAPSSVKLAAKELQRVLEISTGAKLAITNAPSSPMIALGTGLPTEKLPDEAFQIVTKSADLFIVGKDTADGQQTWGSSMGAGFSRGTLFGVYSFLEKVVGVRWLLPGPDGEDIPPHPTLQVPELSITEAPDFKMRMLTGVQGLAYGRPGLPVVDEWIRRQKLGGSDLIMAGHAWDDIIPPKLLQQHPAWMAVEGDKGKLCTSNEELVKTFGERMIRWIDDHPGNRYYSISPLDGGGFCKCPKCMALVEPDPHGNPSYSRVILKFIDDVARIVAQKHPDKILTSYVYYNYMYPPKEPVKMEPNVHLRWAALEYYGFGLYKPHYRDEFESVARGWTRITTNFSYLSYTDFYRSNAGAPVPPPIEILKMELPIMNKVGAIGADMFGAAAWGYGAPMNYILAKQMWDADLDVDQLYHEWFNRAYGPGAPEMEKLYALLLEGFKQNELKETKRNYDVTHDVISDVHVPRFAQLEELYRKALAKAATDAQRKRLQLFGDTMVQFHYNLRRAGLVKDAEKSLFYRSDEDFPKFMAGVQSFIFAPERKAIWAPEKRQLKIPRLAQGTQAPAIDGDLSDTAWTQAAVAEEFRLEGSRLTSKHSTTARLLYDDRNLYLAFECEERSANEIVAQNKVRDDVKNYWDDVVEIFFCDTPDLNRFWHLAVNPLGTQWDGLNDKVAYNLDWTSAGKVNKNRWTVEIAIPFVSLKLTEAPAGKTWRANLCREQKPKRENSSWNSVEEKFAVPEQFGEWIFGK